MSSDPFLQELQGLLGESPDFPGVLARTLQRFDCVVGTLHRLDPDSGLLELQAQVGVPDAVLGKIQSIPIGMWPANSST